MPVAQEDQKRLDPLMACTMGFQWLLCHNVLALTLRVRCLPDLFPLAGLMTYLGEVRYDPKLARN